MAIADVIKTINLMQADGVIEKYAIGGAVGATFYLNPVSTEDVDIFVELHAQAGSLLISLDPILDYLKAKGFLMVQGHVKIGDWPVQFLPPTGPLAEEALERAVLHTFDGIEARVFTAEHLAAIALQTGRAKDKARLLQFVEEEVLNLEKFLDIVSRFGLMEAWHKYKALYLS